ncbi:hypothetical protein DP114_15160 [Brasilonema sennae CENA114]|uniref:PEP-CTERM sorting domain-containing protein n=1 Tax=Brasilonema sennae CENA114 TaxID=415709 RepID=A0A856MFX0_9CYAN|nr:hypothetical protein [Brasilonema sennae]QDL09059.1 hypothetical protein DP114_15160 [Brasilonema sennae CENA114]
MMINRLAKFISAATVLAMTVSFAPQSALAQKFSGAVNNNIEDTLEFDLETSAPNRSGIFYGAIQNPVYIDKPPFQLGDSTETSREYKFNPADLKVSLAEISDSLRNVLNTQSSGSSFENKYGSTVVKYEARLEDNSNPKNFVNFAFYAPYTEPFTNLNSLSVFNASNLTPFLNSQGQVIFPKYISPLNESDPQLNPLPNSTLLFLTPTPDDVTKVPEPAGTASLLGFGIVSTALLRKRNKCLKA